MTAATPMATLTVSAVTVWILQKAKEIPWLKWVSADKPQANRLAALILAGAATLGVTASYNPSAHILTISGLSAAGILSAAWLWLRQFVTQELVYQVAANQPKPAAVVQGVPAKQGPHA